MYITGILGDPSTYLGHTAIMSAIATVENFAKNHRGKYITIVRVECEVAYITGIRGRLDRETIFTTEAEMLAERDKLSRFFSPREVYILEVKPTTVEAPVEEETTPGLKPIENARGILAFEGPCPGCGAEKDDHHDDDCGFGED